MAETRNSAVLADFIAYCEAHPTERFWQAVRNWSGQPFILAAQNKDRPTTVWKDTFYWEGRSG